MGLLCVGELKEVFSEKKSLNRYILGGKTLRGLLCVEELNQVSFVSSLAFSLPFPYIFSISRFLRELFFSLYIYLE